mgnify:CR=1 FL=1
MSNSIEIRMPFLDKEVRLFNLSIPQNIKYRNGYTKSILRDSFKEKIPLDLLQQNFKQGLNKQNFQIGTKNKEFMNEIFNQNEFKQISIFNNNNIIGDLSNDKNLNILWELCKSYLILSGFKKNLKDINIKDEKGEQYNYLKD